MEANSARTLPDCCLVQNEASLPAPKSAFVFHLSWREGRILFRKISDGHNPRISFPGDRFSPHIKQAPVWDQGLQLKDLQDKGPVSESALRANETPQWINVLIDKFDDLSSIPRIDSVELTSGLLHTPSTAHFAHTYSTLNK